MPLYGEEVGLDSVGGVLGLYAGLVLIVRIVGARLPDRLGWRKGSAIALAGVTIGIWVVAASGSVASIWVAAVFLAIGMSLMYPSLFTAVMGAAPEEERTHAVGTFSVFFDVSQGLGATMVGVVVSLTSGNERAGFAAAGALAFGGLVAQTLLRNRIGRPRAPAGAGRRTRPGRRPDRRGRRERRRRLRVGGPPRRLRPRGGHRGRRRPGVRAVPVRGTARPGTGRR